MTLYSGMTLEKWRNLLGDLVLLGNTNVRGWREEVIRGLRLSNFGPCADVI
jgi:hypothetical protein